MSLPAWKTACGTAPGWTPEPYGIRITTVLYCCGHMCGHWLLSKPHNEAFKQGCSLMHINSGLFEH